MIYCIYCTLKINVKFSLVYAVISAQPFYFFEPWTANELTQVSLEFLTILKFKKGGSRIVYLIKIFVI